MDKKMNGYGKIRYLGDRYQKETNNEKVSKYEFIYYWSIEVY